MKRSTYLIAVIFALAISEYSQSPRLTAGDLRPLEGKQWIGELTYLDYQSKKPTSIKSNVTVSRRSSDKLKWTFTMQYPLEPKADRVDEVVLSEDGRTFDGETVTESTRSPDGTLRIVTTMAGKDDHRDATIRHTYLVGPKAFSIKKEVKFDGSDTYFVRNTYRWTR